MTANVVPLPARTAKTEPPRVFKFTQPSLKKTCATFDAMDAKNVILRDEGCRGLILRKQSRDWVVGLERKVKGKIHRHTLETYDPVVFNLAAARQEIARILGEIAAGTWNPVAQKETETQHTALSNMTTEGALVLHAELNPHLRPRTVESYARAIARLTEGKRRLMRDVTPAYVRTAYHRVLESHSAATANIMLRSVRAVWNSWAEEHPEGTEPGRNPTRVITAKRGRMQKAPVREGALAPAQRRPWFDAANELALQAGPTGTALNALLFLFLTGLRRNEAFGLRWDEVNTDEGVIIIGADRMKGREALRRPITRGMGEILERQKLFNPDNEYVFPANRGDGPLIDARKSLWTVNRVALGDAKAIVLHDLRRTYVSTAMMAGIPDVAVKLLVGHNVTDITESYARALKAELPEIASKVERALLGTEA